jgi:hypothetical protein
MQILLQMAESNGDMFRRFFQIVTCVQNRQLFLHVRILSLFHSATEQHLTVENSNTVNTECVSGVIFFTIFFVMSVRPSVRRNNPVSCGGFL